MVFYIWGVCDTYLVWVSLIRVAYPCNKHLRSYQNGYWLMTTCTHSDFLIKVSHQSIGQSGCVHPTMNIRHGSLWSPTCWINMDILLMPRELPYAVKPLSLRSSSMPFTVHRPVFKIIAMLSSSFLPTLTKYRNATLTALIFHSATLPWN